MKLDIYSGLLGTGKTTLIKQMLKTAYVGHKVAVIENEVGKVNLDAEELKQASISVKEISSGCICCTVKGSFTEAVKLLAQQENPDYIVVEPSGVADLCDVVNACIDSNLVVPNRVILVVNAKKIVRLLSVVGEFFLEQLKHCQTMYLNYTERMTAEEVEAAKLRLWEENPNATLVTVPMNEIVTDTFEEGNVNPAVYEKRGSVFGQDASKMEMKSLDGISVVHNQNTKGAAVMMKPIQENGLTNWCYEFKERFDEDKITSLMELFQKDSCKDIWRVKGYLQMEDHTVKKVDCVFGDQFQENLDDFASDKTNKLIVIGKKMNLRWLSQKFSEIDRATEAKN